MKKLTVLRQGMKNALTKDWQRFLLGMKLYKGAVDGDFGPGTAAATTAFQQKCRLPADGIVGPATWTKAVSLGFHLAIADPLPSADLSGYPSKPDFPPLVTNLQREAIFGKITFRPDPRASNPEAVLITNSFERDNIVLVELPQLAKATNGKFTRMRFHRLAAEQLQGFFEEMEKQDLLQHILSYGGGYAPRFVRGSRKTLSNHAYGTAFDINMAWNGLGCTPAMKGQKGCVRELVEIGYGFGFYWGGHFKNPDGMHFEVAKLL
jgi:hypothetical protein